MTLALAHSPNWYAERQTFLGGSDAPIITRDDPWTTPYELFLEKRGEAEPRPDNELMRWGRYVEPAIARMYADETGRRLIAPDPEKVRRHRRFPFLAVHADRLVRGERRLVECKSSWRPWEEIPDRVTVQVQHAMGVLGYDVADVALLTGFGGFAVYEIPRDDLMIERLFTIERAWWQRHMVEGLEPERTGRFRDSVRGVDTMVASDVQAQRVAELRAIRERIAQLEAAKGNVEEWLKGSMAGANRLNGRDYGFSISWKPWEKTSQVTDWELIAPAYRELIDRVLIRDPDALELGADPFAALTAIESLYTRQVTKGARPFKVTWKDVEPTSSSEEE